MLLARVNADMKLTSLLICFVLLFYLLLNTLLYEKHETSFSEPVRGYDSINNFSATDNETGFPYFIVPNVIHLVHFGKSELSFGEVISLKSAYINQKPDRLLIHCNCYNITGEYWDLVKDISVLEIVYREQPESVFGKKIKWLDHASDVARIEILMEYGGIYLDSDVYVVKSLDKYRKYEFVLNWDPGDFMRSQVLIAHKDARFLKAYYELYHDYQHDLWYYNADELPTITLLDRFPHLVHRVTSDFGVDIQLVNMLYRQKTDHWKDFFTIHLFLCRKRYLVKEDPLVEFNLENIKTYNRTFGDMARLVLFGKIDIVPESE